MRTTRVQPPDMKGKKHYRFRCGCCSARNSTEIELERIALKEAAAEAVAIARSHGVVVHPRVAAIKRRAALGE